MSLTTWLKSFPTDTFYPWNTSIQKYSAISVNPITWSWMQYLFKIKFIDNFV